jgi:hypothetical protein
VVGEFKMLLQKIIKYSLLGLVSLTGVLFLSVLVIFYTTFKENKMEASDKFDEKPQRNFLGTYIYSAPNGKAILIISKNGHYKQILMVDNEIIYESGLNEWKTEKREDDRYIRITFDNYLNLSRTIDISGKILIDKENKDIINKNLVLGTVPLIEYKKGFQIVIQPDRPYFYFQVEEEKNGIGKVIY